MGKKATLLKKLLELESFNAPEAREIQERARVALASLPRDLSPRLVERVWSRFLAEAPYDLWRIVHRVHPEHLDAVLRALESTPGEAPFQVRLLLGSVRGREGDERLESFRSAAEFVHFVAVKRVWVPKNRSEVRKLDPFRDDATLLAALRVALADPPDQIDATSRLAFWHGVALLLGDADPESARVAAHLEDSFGIERPDEARQLQLLRRLT